MATVAGTLIGIVAAGNAGGSIDFMLCGYGSRFPKEQGTGIFCDVQKKKVKPAADGTFTVNLISNDQIAPSGTYYTATTRNANGDAVQCNAYLFLGAQTYNLNQIDPFDPSQPAPPLPPLIINQLLVVPFSATPN